MNNKKHKKFRRVHISSKVDDKPPHFNASAYLKAFDLQQDALRVKKIDKENIKLLKKINIIHRLGVSIATSLTVKLAHFYTYYMLCNIYNTLYILEIQLSNFVYMLLS